MIKIIENIPEKGAAIQKDMKTYAVIPYLPGGFTDTQTLRKIADIADKYGASALKLTSEHRIMIIGIKYGDINKIWVDLGIKPGGFTGKIVRPVKFCVGASYCKIGKQNTIELGKKVDETFMGIKTPNKVKMAIQDAKIHVQSPKLGILGV